MRSARSDGDYFDCPGAHLPFGQPHVTAIVERNSIAQDHHQALLAAERVLTAQKQATRPMKA